MDPKDAAKKGTETASEEQEGVIEEGNLLKSIQEIEAKAKGEEAAAEEGGEAGEPEVETARVEKSLTETVEAEGSDELKKAIEVSPFLKEFTDIVGLHVDGALKALEKSLNAAATRDLATVGALGALAGQVESLAKSVSEFGDKPAAPASAKQPSTSKEEVLEKSAGSEAGEPGAETPAGSGLNHPQVYAALESLVKRADEKGDRTEADRWTRAYVKFDSTKTLDQAELAGVAQEHARLHAA